MKQLIVTVISIILFSFSVFSVCAVGSAESKQLVQMTTQETNVEYNTANQQHDNSSTNFLQFVETTLKSSATYVSIGGILIVGIYTFFKKKDMPILFKALSPFLLFILIFISRLCLYSANADILITIYISSAFIGTYLLLLHLWEKSQITTQENIMSRDKKEKRVCNLTRKIIKNTHSSIKCIQIYSLEKNKCDNETKFNVSFLGGSVKPNINVNALFSSTFVIPNKLLVQVEAIQECYTKLKTDGCFSESAQNLIANLIEDEIDRFRKHLNNIPSIDAVTEQDCYIARILLIYLSIYATITEHDTYIGLRRDSLGLDNPKIEAHLFTYERTGMIGSILFEKMPYIFSYMKGNNKNGRFYYTFSCGRRKKYIIMITLTNKDKKLYIDYHMANNLTSIMDKIIAAFDSKETKEANN